jgi:hypothetical protein
MFELFPCEIEGKRNFFGIQFIKLNNIEFSYY